MEQPRRHEDRRGGGHDDGRYAVHCSQRDGQQDAHADKNAHRALFFADILLHSSLLSDVNGKAIVAADITF